MSIHVQLTGTTQICSRLTGNLINSALGQLRVRWEVDVSLIHRAETLQCGIGARVDFAVVESVSVAQSLDLEVHVATDFRDTVHADSKGPVVRCEEDVEVCGREARVRHARVQRLGLEHAYCGDEGYYGGQRRKKNG